MSYSGWWSADILGGDTPLDFLSVIGRTIGARDVIDLPTAQQPENLSGWVFTRKLLEKPSVVKKLIKRYKRTGYNKDVMGQVIGVIYLWTGAEMPEKIRQIALDAAAADAWAREGGEDRERRIHDFRQAILEHRSGQRTELKDEGLVRTMLDKAMGGLGSFAGSDYTWISDNGKWGIEVSGAYWYDDSTPYADGYITDRRKRKYNAVWFTAESKNVGARYIPEQLKLQLSTMGTAVKKKDIPQYVRDKAVDMANLAIIAARDAGGDWYPEGTRAPVPRRSSWGSFSGRQFQTIHADPGPYNRIERYVQWSLERNARSSDAAVYHARGQHDLARKAEDAAQQLDVALLHLARELGPRDYDYADNLLAKIQRGANVVWNRR